MYTVKCRAIFIPTQIYLIAVTLLLCTACTRVEDPIIAGIDSSDRDLVDYLEEVQQSALAMESSALARGRLAMAYDINGLLDEALATYQQAEALDPSEFRWPYFRAHVIAEIGDHEHALQVLERAAAIDRNYSPVWLFQGSWLLKTERPDDALIAFQRATDLEPGPSPNFGRAQALIAAGKYGQAIKILEPLSKTTLHPQVYRTLGEALRSVGRTEEARKALAKGKDAGPLTWPDERRDERNNHVRGHASYQLAKTLSASGRADEALIILQRLQTYHPEQACGAEQGIILACNLMNSFSIAFDRAGRTTSALETVQRGLDINPEFIPFHLTIANLYRQDRKLESALAHLDKAIELNPSRGYPHEQRGRLLFGLARYNEARTALQIALQFEPEKQTTLFYLGLTEVELSNWTAAAGHFQHVTRIEQDSPLGHMFLARSLGELGRIEDAWHAYHQAQQYGADPREFRSTEQRLRELKMRQVKE